MSIYRYTRRSLLFFFFFFNDTATTEIYTLSLHDALPIWEEGRTAEELERLVLEATLEDTSDKTLLLHAWPIATAGAGRSEEHTSELQSLAYLVCRLLLEKKKINTGYTHAMYCDVGRLYRH